MGDVHVIAAVGPEAEVDKRGLTEATLARLARHLSIQFHIDITPTGFQVTA